jgi:hypothetical protein
MILRFRHEGSPANNCSKFLNIVVMAGLDPAIHAFMPLDTKVLKKPHVIVSRGWPGQAHGCPV